MEKLNVTLVTSDFQRLEIGVAHNLEALKSAVNRLKVGDSLILQTHFPGGVGTVTYMLHAT